MNRRTFLTIAAGSSTVIISGAWFAIEPNSKSLTIAQSLNDIARLKKEHFNTTGEWDLARVLTHCAQSVEYSMIGYPEHKSDVFKSTIGSLAFTAFAQKGKMTHNLAESIPGAPTIKAHGMLDLAIARLEKAFIDFSHFKGELKPHFAYGVLTKAEYELAHVMHLNNHFKEIKRVPV